MEKPIIFFSHSSKDKNFLISLKNKILGITSNTIEIFQSSDGESIPFGNNWVHKIENNLNDTKLMFVFVSPNSLKSNWIYFEAGYSYSKGIKVIPIGILGIDIGQLAPPINLLQGFNITSFEGLNNLITIINREFSTSFLEDFNIDDYEGLVSKTNIQINTNPNLNNIDYFKTEFSSKLTDNKHKESAFIDVCAYLKTTEIKHSIDGKNRIYFHGMVLSKNSEGFEFKIDQLKLEENFEIISSLINIVYEKKVEHYWMAVHFLDKIELLTTDFKLTSRLSNMGIEMSSRIPKFFEYKNISFTLDDESTNIPRSKAEGKRLRIVYDFKSFQTKEVYEIIDLLIEQKIIWTKN
jgi:hypothetical protein